ncbi:MAG: ImmA/IrrE family metallo-endopeptidase [Myxococcales bacterium]|nr:ImmA/IrrE family metallo-endopeptidase [Myxococcales bacterium]
MKESRGRRWAHVRVGDVVELEELAAACGVRIIPTPGRTYSAGDVVWLRARARPIAARWQLAHELGHVLAARGGLDRSCERTASTIGAALLLPRRTLVRELHAHAWDLEPIIERHWVTWMIAVRPWKPSRPAGPSWMPEGRCAGVVGRQCRGVARSEAGCGRSGRGDLIDSGGC